MLLWKELVDQAHESQLDITSSHDDLKLLQIYLCRLFLTPGYGNALSLFNGEANLKLLGVDTRKLDERVLTDEREQLAAIRKRERALTASLKGKPELSFEPLLRSLVRFLKPSLVETKLLIYAILLVRNPQARQLLRELEINEYTNSVSALSRALREPARSVSEALDDAALLCQIRLIESPSRNADIWDLVEAGPLLVQLVLSTQEPEQAQSTESIEQALFGHICPVGPEPLHTLNEFQGVPELQLLLDYLRDALANKHVGKNILLHGQPGTGKTQLARTLAARLGAPLHEVPTKDAGSSAMTGRIRLDAAKLAQMFLEDRLGAVLLFDEMEDAFRSDTHLAKGWFNQLLEENQAPVIWISNDISRVDPAFLRRFDFIVEIKGTGTAKQVHKLHRQLSGLPVSDQWLEAAANQPWMTPALARNLADLGRYLPEKQILRNQQRLEGLLTERLSAMQITDRVKLLRPERKADFPAFRSEWLTTTPSLNNVERTVRASGSGRVCLYGPPGAGKTAYAEELARRLKRPFMLFSGSDLLDKFVGETEKRIAAMFREAEAKGAVLLLDEADSFLYSRGMADRTWEVSQVNEFMVRLERFDGIFMATTNRFDSLDKAVLRRLPLKVEFGYLSSKQIKDILQACVVDVDKAALLTEADLERFQYLTPGLIRAAVQNLKLRGFEPRLERLLRAMEAEQKQQTDGVIARPIGFVG